MQLFFLAGLLEDYFVQKSTKVKCLVTVKSDEKLSFCPENVVIFLLVALKSNAGAEQMASFQNKMVITIFYSRIKRFVFF